MLRLGAAPRVDEAGPRPGRGRRGADQRRPAPRPDARGRHDARAGRRRAGPGAGRVGRAPTGWCRCSADRTSARAARGRSRRAAGRAGSASPDPLRVVGRRPAAGASDRRPCSWPWPGGDIDAGQRCVTTALDRRVAVLLLGVAPAVAWLAGRRRAAARSRRCARAPSRSPARGSPGTLPCPPRRRDPPARRDAQRHARPAGSRPPPAARVRRRRRPRAAQPADRLRTQLEVARRTRRVRRGDWAGRPPTACWPTPPG